MLNLEQVKVSAIIWDAEEHTYYISKHTRIQ